MGVWLWWGVCDPFRVRVVWVFLLPVWHPFGVWVVLGVWLCVCGGRCDDLPLYRGVGGCLRWWML